jgi:hypothetical protein
VHEANARFVKGDPTDLAARIDYWLDHPEQRITQGRFNRLFAEAFRHDKTARTLMTFYDEVLREEEPPSPRARLTGTS